MVPQDESRLLVGDFDLAVRLEIDFYDARLFPEGRSLVVAKIGAKPAACLVLEIVAARAAGNRLLIERIGSVDIFRDSHATAIAAVAARPPVDAADENRAAEVIFAIALEEGRSFRS